MITKALHDYLVSGEAITGYPSAPFADPQVVAGLTIADRDEAKRYLRDRIGTKHIYAARRPREGSQNTAVTLRRIVTDRQDSVSGGTRLADAIIQVDVWTRYADAVLRGEVIANLIRLACEGFGGASWGDMSIADCLVVRESEFQETPQDGDDWQYRYSMDLHVFYHQASAVR